MAGVSRNGIINAEDCVYPAESRSRISERCVFMKTAKRVLIAMSGGVDSSVAALLLQEQGYECIGCHMKLHTAEGDSEAAERGCCSLDDAEDARSVAFRLGMPFYVFNLADCFQENVIDPFVRSYERGWTPNPCIDCNRFLKFEKLYERAQALSCDYIATGHYARITETGGEYYLRKASDPSKDQSYVLYTLTQEELKRTLFPLGGMNKDEVRQLAEAHGFLNARKPDSQDICFVPDGDYAAYIERNTGKRYPEGDFIDRSGNVLGRHRGVIHYTVGQRRGLGVSAKTRLYVAGIDPVMNTVTLAEEENFQVDTVFAERVSTVSGDPLKERRRVLVKLRYRQKEMPATAYMEETRLTILLDSLQRAPAPGQAAVLYDLDGETVLGGGTITGSERRKDL